MFNDRTIVLALFSLALVGFLALPSDAQVGSKKGKNGGQPNPNPQPPVNPLPLPPTPVEPNPPKSKTKKGGPDYHAQILKNAQDTLLNKAIIDARIAAQANSLPSMINPNLITPN